MNKPVIIKTAVSPVEAEERGKWIGMRADIHVCVDIPQMVLRAVLNDYEGYTDVFKRLLRIEMRESPAGFYQDWRVGVEFMKFSYYSEYTLVVTEKLNTPDRYILDYAHVTDDGSVKDTWGQWYLETVNLEGKEWTYVRYSTSSRVIEKFPLQKNITEIIIQMEYKDLMNQFLKAAQTRIAHRR